jgi:hypothetical protein
MTEVERLKKMLHRVENTANWEEDAYQRGVVNGLLLAIAVLENKEVVFRQGYVI